MGQQVKMHLNAKQFTAATEVTALAVTKLDGTAKGGVVIESQISLKFL
jgi:signal recognition particle GTPase